MPQRKTPEKAKRGRGRPPKPRTFETDIRVRLFNEQKDLIQRAADKAAMERGTGDTSDWVRGVLVAAAREVLRGE